MSLSSTHLKTNDSFYSDANFKKLMDRFQNLAFATKEGVWEYDIIEDASFYNEGMMDMWGYSLPEMRDNNKWWRSNIHPQDKSRIITELDDLMSGEKTVWWGKYLFKHKNGTYKLILDRLFIVRSDDGKPMRMIGTMQDLTYLNDLEKELERVRLQERKNMQVSLITASEKERKFISEELHENINQVLATVNMQLASLKKYVRPEGLLSIKQAQEMLVSSIAEVSQISNALSPVILERLGLQKALQQLFSTIFKEDKVSLSIAIDENVLDKKENLLLIVLYRIAQDQFKNISKHSEAENILINIKPDTNNKTRMTVYDDGIGLDLKTVKYGNGFSSIQNMVDAFEGSFSIKTIHGQTGFMLSVSI
jgi:PAS domain S-box-containing protein